MEIFQMGKPRNAYGILIGELVGKWLHWTRREGS